MDYSQYSLESLLSQLETAYYNAKRNYRLDDTGHQRSYREAQKQRRDIKDEIIKRFSCLEQELQAERKF